MKRIMKSCKNNEFKTSSMEKGQILMMLFIFIKIFLANIFLELIIRCMKQEKQSRQAHNLEIKGQQIVTSPISEYFEAYESLMAGNIFNNLGAVKEKLHQNDIEFTDKFCSNISFKIIDLNRDSAALHVSLGHFQTIVTVFRMILQQHQVFEQNFIGSGSNSIVHELNVSNCLYACKSIDISDANNFCSLSHVCKEYVLTKVAGALRIGPQVKPAFGYDIVCFKDRAIFTMELCQTNISIKNESAKDQLKNGLRLFHSLKICHGDIKLENMAYSNITEKYIFLDFGLSRVVCEEIGRKTWTKFFGTYKYASPQMKKFYFFQGFVDLYYNDAYCLNYFLVKAEEKKRQNYDFGDDQQGKRIQPCQVAVIITIRYLLFKGKFNLALNQILEEQFIAKSLLKIFIQEFYMKRKECSLQMDKYLKLLKSNVENNENRQTLIDNILSAYLQQFYNKELDNEFVNISSYIESNLSISLIWEEDLWMDQIAIFLEADPKNDEVKWTREDFPLRKKLIEKIFNFLGYSCSLSEQNCAFLFKFRTVLMCLHEYYKSKENLRFLEAIRILFMKIDAYPDQYKVQVTILQLYKKLGKPRDELAIKKIQFLLFRQFGALPNFYSFHDIFQINNTEYPQFLEPFINQPTTLESLFNQLVNFDFSTTDGKKYQQISDFMERAQGEQYEIIYKQAVCDLILFCKSMWHFSILKRNYNQIQNKSFKLALKKRCCFLKSGASEVFAQFQEDLYLSNIRGYFEIFKNLHNLSLKNAQQACAEYFQIFCTQLQFFPHLFDIIYSLHQYRHQQKAVIFFITLFISSFQQSPLKTKTYALEYIKFIYKLISYFYRHELLKTYSQILQKFTAIFHKCHIKVLTMKMCPYENVMIQFCLILINNLKKDKNSLAFEILQFSNKITIKQLMADAQLHTVIEIISVSWSWLSESKSNSDLLEQIENFILSISEKCLQQNWKSLFLDYSWNLNVLQQIFQKRNLFKQEFYFLISMAIQKDKFTNNDSEYSYFKIDIPYHYFVENTLADDLAKIAKIICESLGIKTITRHYHLSGLFMEIYLKSQTHLPMEQRRKLLTIIAFGFSNILSVIRKNLLLSVFYKKHLKVFDGKSKRKQLICLRHEGRHKRSMRKCEQNIIMKNPSKNNQRILEHFEGKKLKYRFL